MKNSHLPYGLGGSTLTITSGTTALIFEPNTSTGGNGAAATLGCFRMGVFTPSPLAPIP